MTAKEMALLPRYQAAVGLHGYRGIARHRVARLVLRVASAAAYEAAAGNQRRSKAWKDGVLHQAHDRAIERIRRLAKKGR